MIFNILGPDPLDILSSTKTIVEKLQFITIHEDRLNTLATLIGKNIHADEKIDLEKHFGHTDNLEQALQIIFLEDVVNFCYWAEKGKAKWVIEWPKGTISSGGWYTLTKCFERAQGEKIPVLDPDCLINLTAKQARNFFRSANGVEIPLLKERLENFREAGNNLKKKYNGKFINAVEAADFDAVKIAKLVYEDFPSFRDFALWENEKIFFLKRAQICGQDCGLLGNKYKIKIKNIDQLTAFADYKVPQMLRKYGVITYNKNLSEKIDDYILIPAGSREEIEIRAVTIWSIELIRQKLRKYTAANIDNALWFISQDQTGVKPYHRTYTIYY